MVLTDRDITKHRSDGLIIIEPFDKARLGSNSYDLTLSKHLLTYNRQEIYNDELDCKRDNPVTRFEIPEEGFVLEPGELYLGCTAEYTETHKLMPYIEGKSSVGRLGITAHITAGAGDIGFKGHWTLEITVVRPVRVYAGMPICQILYMMPLGNCDVPYGLKKGNKYQGQGAFPMPSQMYKNFKTEPV